MTANRAEEIRSTVLDRDIHWARRARLIREFHEVMVLEHGPGQPKSGIGWSIRKTADALKIPQTSVYLNVRAAVCLDRFRGDPADFRTLNEFLTQMDVISK